MEKMDEDVLSHPEQTASAKGVKKRFWFLKKHREKMDEEAVTKNVMKEGSLSGQSKFSAEDLSKAPTTHLDERREEDEGLEQCLNWERQWKFHHGYNLRQNGFVMAGIGVRQFAAANGDAYKVTIHSIDLKGKVEGTIHVNEEPRAIAPTRQGNHIIVVCKDQVRAFNQDGSFAFLFSRISYPKTVGKTDVDLCSIGVKDSGNILVGDKSRSVIIEHSQDGAVLRTISVTTEPLRLAILDEGRVVLSDRSSLVVVDCETGAQIASLIKKDHYYVQDVCCWNRHIFVAYDEHIHWHGAGGQFQGCIGQDLVKTKRVTFTTDGQFLLTVDLHSCFTVYKNPLIEDKPGETAMEKPLAMQSTAGLKQQMSSLRLPCDRRPNWERHWEFKPDCSFWPGYINIAGIGVRQFAAADWHSRRIIIYSIEEKVEERNIDVGQDSFVWVMAFTRQGNRIIVICKDHVDVFNQDGSLAFKFLTISSDEAGKTDVDLCSIGVKDSGIILVGDKLRRVITKHSQAGYVLRTISVTTEPQVLAILDEGRVVLGDCQNVVVVDCETGAQLASIMKERDFTDVCCWNCHIFVATCNSHIHWYDAEGLFQGYIDHQRLKSHTTITFTTDGQFLVAGSVYGFVVYKNPLIEDKPRETALKKPLTMQSTADEDKDQEACKTQDDLIIVKSDKSMTKVLYTAQDDASPLPTVGGPHSSPKTHLQLLLDEFNNQTANMSESDRLETLLQLPYIALGYFDHKGGSLDLKESGVHLTIPQGALPEGQDPQLVYIYIDPTAPQLNKMTPPEVPLAPVVQCGPRGLKFEKSVILSFPHSASGKDDQINPRMRHDDPREGEWEEFDGKAMFVTDDRVIFLVDYFTLFYTVSKSLSDGSATLLTLAAFGHVLDPTSGRYRIRVHIWNHGDKETEMNVKRQEEEKSSRMLDVFKILVFSLHQGDLVIEVTDLIEGWTTCGSSRENIAHEKIRHITSNSVTFDLTQQQQAAASSASDLYCNVLSYQKSADELTRSWNNVRFAIHPQLNCPSRRPKGDNQASCCTCGENAGSACASSSNCCDFCKEQIRLSFFRKQHGDASPEEFGGLPEKVSMELCKHLDEDGVDKRPRWKQLADNLGVWGKLTEKCGAYDYLQIHYEVRRASSNISSRRPSCSTLL